MPAPLPAGIRSLVASNIRNGLGCNEIARGLGISPGTVSRIARHEELHFAAASKTRAAAESRRHHAAIARIDREHELLNELMSLPQTTRQRDGRDTRRFRKIDRALRDLDRHHDRW